MTTQVAYIATLVTLGFTLAVVIGFSITGELPVWLAIPVIIAVSIVGLLGCEKKKEC